jgi:undecaprenyl-diphosphatase
VSVLHAIVLGIVQGLTEFLPISSSGHLILVPELFGWTELTKDADLERTFDVALHMGTLVGAVWYFRSEVAHYAAAAVDSVRTRSVRTTDARMAWLLALSAVPGAIVGAAIGSTVDDELGDPVLIGVMLILGSFVLLWADRLSGERRFETYRRRDALVMGAAQAVALQPGVSRSAITISAGRFLSFDRDAATRLSFLMSLPIIAGAGIFEGAEVMREGGIADDLIVPFLCGMIASAISGWIAISWLLRFLRTRSFTPFVVYRIALGVIVIIVFATGLR